MYEHASGLPNAFDRSAARPNDAGLVFVEGSYAQGAEMNELQAYERRRNGRLSDMVTADGSRISGASIAVTKATSDAVTGTVQLAAGRIKVAGDVHDVAAATKTGIAMVGTVRVGVRLVSTLVTWEDAPELLGLGAGTDSEDESGAARLTEAISWAIEDDGEPGDFYAVYTLRDGAVIDQTVAPDLTGVKAVLAENDVDAHGNYIVRGCVATALGRIAGAQVFDIQPGVANIMGWKRSRAYALRHAEPEVPETEIIAAETHLYPSSDPATFLFNAPPAVAALPDVTVVVQKREVETVVRGSVPGGIDALAHTSVVAIESVVQGGTTFAGTTYALASDGVSWAPAGAEPAASSTYTVTYRRNVAVVPSALTETSVTVSGGVAGTPALLSYKSKLPRIDLLCLTQSGETAYVKGVPARKGAMPPICPSTLLKLAEIRNTWLDKPEVVNDGDHSIPFGTQGRYNGRIIDILDSFNRMALEHDVRGRAVGLKGVFTDPLTDDFLRDQGAAQTAAIVDGRLVLAVDLVGVALLGTEAYTLPYTAEMVVEQAVASSAMKINPYANFVSLPADLKLEPAVDFWTTQETDWTSAQTAEFTTVTDAVPAGTVTAVTTVTKVESERSSVATILRQIDIQATIDGFGVGETLATLTFDSIDVKPAGTQTADADGKISLSFTIPAGVPTGTRLARATGAAGSFAEALFHGEGTINVQTLREVTLVTRAVRATVVNVTNVTNVMTTSGTSESAHGDGGGDPLAQTFLVSEPRQIVGCGIKFATIGDRTKGVRAQLSGVSDGLPTSEVLAQSFVGMASVAANAWVSPMFGLPVFVPAVSERAFVFLTDDATHALAISRLGDVITAGDGSQSFVTENPSNVGVLQSSSNRRTWTPHNDADATFRAYAARYTATERLVVLGTVDLVNVSDLVVRGTVELPTEACSVAFEVVRADGTVIAVQPDQTLEFAEYVTETVTIRARLKGTATLSPILYPGVSVGLGRIRAEGTYVSKVFDFKAAPATLSALFAELLPSGAAVTVDWDAADGTWHAMTLASTEVLTDGWREPKYTVADVAAAAGRVRITITGGPAARPELARARAYTI